MKRRRGEEKKKLVEMMEYGGKQVGQWVTRQSGLWRRTEANGARGGGVLLWRIN